MMSHNNCNGHFCVSFVQFVKMVCNNKEDIDDSDIICLKIMVKSSAYIM